MSATRRTLRPDSKGRVPLGKLLDAKVSSYQAEVDSDGRIILTPLVEIPAREKWLFDNKKALASVKRGIEDSAAGRVKSLGSFAKYADDTE